MKKLLALLLALVLGPVAFRAVEGLFWFFTYQHYHSHRRPRQCSRC